MGLTGLNGYSMLSRVADSLYWMSRYFERADHCARVLESNYTLMLNPSKPSTEERWLRITSSLGSQRPVDHSDPQADIARLVSDPKGRYSIVGCISSARDNARQIREQISSEMWECLNQLYHEVGRMQVSPDADGHPLRLIDFVREGAYKFSGITDATMSHDKGWQFIQFGRYMERACAISKLVDAYFLASSTADDLDWVALLTSCLAFEAYCKVYTADLSPDRVAEFLLLNADFPYTVRHSVDSMREALQGMAETPQFQHVTRIDRMIGQLRASLAYTQIEDIMRSDLHEYLTSTINQCGNLHHAIYELYIDYPIASALEA